MPNPARLEHGLPAPRPGHAGKGAYFVEDLGSGNGTFLNGKRIDERTPLKANDRLKLGPILLRFEPGDGSRNRLSRTGSVDSVEISGDVTATIMESADNASGFGVLQVRPEAKLRAVIEIARSLAGTVDLQAIVPLILDTLFTHLPAGRPGLHPAQGCRNGRHACPSRRSIASRTPTKPSSSAARS